MEEIEEEKSIVLGFEKESRILNREEADMNTIYDQRNCHELLTPKSITPN